MEARRGEGVALLMACAIIYTFRRAHICLERRWGLVAMRKAADEQQRVNYAPESVGKEHVAAGAERLSCNQSDTANDKLKGRYM